MADGGNVLQIQRVSASVLTVVVGKFDPVAVEVRWDKRHGTNKTILHFYTEMGMLNITGGGGAGFFVHEGIISAVERVEF
jgi:hypothetical protein